MNIYILSSGRAGRQTTWHGLPPSVQAKTKIVVPWDEREAYQAYDGHTFSDPEIVRDVTRTRQWLCDRSEKICMLDDDLVFAVRRKDDPTKFKTAIFSEIALLFDDIEAHLEEYHHVGVSSREGGNHNSEPYLENTRMMRVLAYNSVAMRENSIRIDRLKFMSDFDVTLQFLRKGHKNLVINWMVQNQNGSNSVGGCSQYRTVESQTADARKLASFHPEYVKLINKQTKNWGALDLRVDVRVQWKKAIQDANNSSKCIR